MTKKKPKRKYYICISKFRKQGGKVKKKKKKVFISRNKKDAGSSHAWKTSRAYQILLTKRTTTQKKRSLVLEKRKWVYALLVLSTIP